MVAQALTYLHLLAAPLLLLPLISLSPPPKSPPDELPGIRPITIRRVTPRRGFILTFLVLLAFTSFLDGALLVADLLTASSRNGASYLFKGELAFAGWVVYAVGGLVIWSMTAIITELRAKWGDKGVVVLATWAFLFEIPNFVFLVIAVVHASEFVPGLLHV
jgi:ATP-binding cassette subfamily B (MDR/TAP) protein 6